MRSLRTGGKSGEFVRSATRGAHDDAGPFWTGSSVLLTGRGSSHRDGHVAVFRMRRADADEALRKAARGRVEPRNDRTSARL